MHIALTDKTKSLLCVTGLALLPLLTFWDVATFQQIPVAGDIMEYNYPIQYLLTEQIRSGILPLWNNRLASGTPLCGLSQAGVLYPLNYFVAILPPWIAMTCLFLLHYSLAGVFTYAYVRQLGIGHKGACIAGVVFMFSGFLVGHLGHLSMVRTAVWLPAILWAVEKWRRLLNPKFIAIGAVAVGMTILGPHPQMIVYVCGIVALYVTWITLTAKRDYPRYRFAVGGVGIMGLGILLALPQILLMLETFAALARPVSGYEYFTDFSLHPFFLLQVVFPAILRSSSTMSEMIGYAGILPLVLATSAVFWWKHKVKIFVLLLAAFAGLLVLGGYTPFYRLMYHVPLYNAFRVPPRNWLEFDFAIAVLAGAGFDRITSLAGENRHLLRNQLKISAGILILLELSIVGLVVFLFPHLPDLFPAWATKIRPAISQVVLSAPATRTALIIILFSAATTWLLACKGGHWYVAVFTIVLLLSDQYASYAHYLVTIHSVRKSPTEVFEYVPGSVRFLKNDESLYRVLIYSPHFKYNLTEIQNILYSDLSILHDIDSANNYDSMFLKQYAAFTEYSITNNGSVIGPNILFPHSSQILDLLNVKYVIVPANPELIPLGFQSVDGINLESTRYPWLSLGPQYLTEADFNTPQKPMTTLAIASALQGGEDLVEGQKLARVTIVDTDGQRYVHYLLAGYHTAEWTYDCAGTVAQHSEPDVAYDYPAVDAAGGSCPGHLYLARLEVAKNPIVPREVTIEYLAKTGSIYLDKMSLYDATTGLSHPVSVAQGYLGYLFNSETNRLVYQDSFVRIFERTQVLPRAFLVPSAKRVNSPAEANQMVETGLLLDGTSFNPAAVALVEAPASVKLPGETTGQTSRNQYEARIVSTRSGRVEITTMADDTSYLVYSENYFPGWQATIDGKRASVYRTDGTLMGLVVPAGEHQVVLAFVPPALYYGLGASAITIAMMVGLSLERIRRLFWSAFCMWLPGAAKLIAGSDTALAETCQREKNSSQIRTDIAERQRTDWNQGTPVADDEPSFSTENAEPRANAMTKISVVIPAYNEAEHIQACLHETALVLQGLDYEIIAVDDGSQDSTYQDILAVSTKNARVRPVRQSSNQGKGAAVFLGCQYATGELIAFLDADLELHPSLLLAFIKTMHDMEADVVVGAKGHPDSKLKYPLFRRITSIFYSLLIRFLFGLNLHDTQTGIKLFRADVLRRVIPRLQVRRFAFDLELLVAANRFGYKIVEAPIVVSFQRPRGGRIGAMTIGHMFLDTLRVFYRASFWKWLEPNSKVKVWIVAFALGLVMATTGMAHWLALYIPVPPQLSALARILTLRFMNTRIRDWIMIGLGLLLVILALVELNKSLLIAFARKDEGDLAGIIRRNHRAPDDLDKEMHE